MGSRIEAVSLKELVGDPVAWKAGAEKARTMSDDVAHYKSMVDGVPRILVEMEEYSPLDANN